MPSADTEKLLRKLTSPTAVLFQTRFWISTTKAANNTKYAAKPMISISSRAKNFCPGMRPQSSAGKDPTAAMTAAITDRYQQQNPIDRIKVSGGCGKARSC